MKELFHNLKEFAEGRLSLDLWKQWWDNHCEQVKEIAGKEIYLKLKYKPLRYAQEILLSHGMACEPDEKICPECGHMLFYAIPGKTTKDQVQNFFKSAPIFSGKEVKDDTWIHPGRYCPNGCYWALHENAQQREKFWDRMEADRAARETATIVMRPRSHDDTPLNEFKIYLDRYIRTTAPRDTAPEHCVYIELEPGDHAIIVRDYDHLSPDRRESNDIAFSIAESQQIVFELLLVDGTLQLKMND